MIEQVLKRKNLYKAQRKVERNDVSAGIDRMKVGHLPSYVEESRDEILNSIINQTYIPAPILGVEIPKSNGQKRMLGIPTVVDRWLQQAVSQVLSLKFEGTFEEYSYGFRPSRNIHQAVSQSLK